MAADKEAIFGDNREDGDCDERRARAQSKGMATTLFQLFITRER